MWALVVSVSATPTPSPISPEDFREFFAAALTWATGLGGTGPKWVRGYNPHTLRRERGMRDGMKHLMEFALLATAPCPVADRVPSLRATCESGRDTLRALAMSIATSRDVHLDAATLPAGQPVRDALAFFEFANFVLPLLPPGPSRTDIAAKLARGVEPMAEAAHSAVPLWQRIHAADALADCRAPAAAAAAVDAMSDAQEAVLVSSILRMAPAEMGYPGEVAQHLAEIHAGTAHGSRRLDDVYFTTEDRNNAVNVTVRILNRMRRYARYASGHVPAPPEVRFPPGPNLAMDTYCEMMVALGEIGPPLPPEAGEALEKAALLVWNYTTTATPPTCTVGCADADVDEAGECREGAPVVERCEGGRERHRMPVDGCAFEGQDGLRPERTNKRLALELHCVQMCVRAIAAHLLVSASPPAGFSAHPSSPPHVIVSDEVDSDL